MAAVSERVDRLEEALQGFIASVGIEFNKLYNSQMRTEAEMRAFKDEMRAFKDEMGDFKDEMGDFKDEMGDFKDEMRAFKDEMSAFKDEVRQQNREMNRKWGDLSNKLGTMVEDLVAPSLPRIIENRLGQTVLDIMQRRKRRLTDGRVREFDVVAVTSSFVGLNSTKATLRSADVDGFVAEIAAFREFFPEYAALPLIGILASLAVDGSVLGYAERQGFLVLAVGDELMEIKNRPDFEPKRW
jgi:hypothetical protein